MKKAFLIATIFLGMSASIHAQSVKFGIKAGLNYANQTGTDITINSINYKTEAITSYHAGFVAEIKLLNKLAIQPELMYSTQGATYKNAIDEFKNDLGYVSIPLLVKIYLSDSFSLELGPQASFLLSAKDDVKFQDQSTFDAAAVGGLGLKVTKNLFLQARYGLGLTDFSKNAQTKNSVVQVSAGILF